MRSRHWATPCCARANPVARPLVRPCGTSCSARSSTGLDARAEALLFAAARGEHVARVIRPALDRGDVVICDRYLDSSVAYQGHGRDLGARHVRDLSLWATRDLLPDLTVLLDIDPVVGLSRVSDPDRLEAEPLSYHQRVRDAFLVISSDEPDRYLVLDATAACRGPRPRHPRAGAAGAEPRMSAGIWDRLIGQQHVVDELSPRGGRCREDRPRRARSRDDPCVADHRSARLRSVHCGHVASPPPSSARRTAAASAKPAERRPSAGIPTSAVVSTETLSYSIENARELVRQSEMSPIKSHWHVIVMEDADRLTDQAVNVLLKSLEEPPPHTVWILCAPSVEDVLPTIQSRTRHVPLRTPSTADVAQLLDRQLRGRCGDGVLRRAGVAGAHRPRARTGARRARTAAPPGGHAHSVPSLRRARVLHQRSEPARCGRR